MLVNLTVKYIARGDSENLVKLLYINIIYTI